MNPIAFLAFLMSIQTATPQPRPVKEHKPANERPDHKPKPEQAGTAKCGRGGWDGN